MMSNVESVPTDPPTMQQDIFTLSQAVKAGGGWLYAIAGLSLVNSLLYVYGINLSFVFGLSSAVFVTVFAVGAFQTWAPGLAPLMMLLVAFFFMVLACGLFAYLGWKASHKSTWAFVLGMALYSVDSLISLAVEDWLGLAVHAFALLALWRGYSSLKKLNELLHSGSTTILPSGA